MKLLSFSDIIEANHRIKKFINLTPILTSKIINQKLKAEVYFKMDCQQITRSFKIRGAFNAVLKYFEIHQHLPQKIVVQSSGNHAQAVAYVGAKLKIPVLIYMANTVSPYKIKLTQDLGAEVILCEKRSQANALAESKQAEGYFFIHPSDNDEVIAGQGTCAYEALREIGEVSAIFAPCGGGGLIAGSYLAKQQLSPNAKVFGCEPSQANDASQSLKLGKITGFDDTPQTIADGARTLKVSPRCFNYLQQISGIIEIDEEKILYWQKYLNEIFQEKIEPTSALGIAGLEAYLNSNPASQNNKFLVLISGGNLE